MRRVAGAAAVVDDDAAALADRQAGVAGELVARADAGREDDHVDVELGAVGQGGEQPVAASRR